MTNVRSSDENVCDVFGERRRSTKASRMFRGRNSQKEARREVREHTRDTYEADSFGFYCVEPGSIWSILPGRKDIDNQNILFLKKVKFHFEKQTNKPHSWQKRGPLYEDCEAASQVITTLQGPQTVGVEDLCPPLKTTVTVSFSCQLGTT